MNNYPPGVTDDTFDEQCFGETYIDNLHCIICEELIPDNYTHEMCDSCYGDYDEEED